MSKQRVGIVRSAGSHFETVIAAARDAYPDAAIIVLTQSESHVEGIDCVHLPRGGVASVLAIRKQRLDAIVVMYGSKRLELLAALSGAPKRFVCPPDGILVPLHGGTVSVVLGQWMRRIRGEVLYWRMRFATRLDAVQTDDDSL